MKGFTGLPTLKVSQTIEDIPEAQWKRVEPLDFPFATYSFLKSLEKSGSIGERTGWIPFYLSEWEQDELSGAMILFAKTNSYGEYIFDWAWANAYANSGLDYYPKFVSAIPFTPATGPKILLRSSKSVNRPQLIDGTTARLIAAADALMNRTGASSAHALFISEKDFAGFESAGYFLRHSFQFHWRNNNYVSFDSFLAALTSKRRKEILRERRQVEKANVTIERLSGSQLTEDHADIMYQFYLSTIDKMGGHDYLTHEFYRQAFASMKDSILFVLARDRNTGRPVAGALNYFGSETLYGRNWGCLADYKSLHFELCYYQGIEFAIERGFHLFEAGAQGEHKLSRGFLPTLTYSAHKIVHPQLGRAIQSFVDREKDEIAKAFKVYNEHSPFSASATTAPPGV